MMLRQGQRHLHQAYCSSSSFLLSSTRAFSGKKGGKEVGDMAEKTAKKFIDKTKRALKKQEAAEFSPPSSSGDGATPAPLWTKLWEKSKLLQPSGEVQQKNGKRVYNARKTSSQTIKKGVPPPLVIKGLGGRGRSSDDDDDFPDRDRDRDRNEGSFFNPDDAPEPINTVGGRKRRNNGDEPEPIVRLVHKFIYDEKGVPIGRDESDMEELAPEVASVLFETKGYKFADTSFDNFELDDVDTFLGSVWLEANKTEENTVMILDEDADFKHIQIPKPRNLAHLLREIRYDVPASVTHPYAIEVTNQAWGVLSKNYWLSEPQKRYMAHMIATNAQKVLQQEAEYWAYKKANPKPIVAAEGQELSKKLLMYAAIDDMIFDENFRPGLLYMEQQEAESRLLVKVDENAELYKQGETDWKQRAVVDEDQL